MMNLKPTIMRRGCLSLPAIVLFMFLACPCSVLAVATNTIPYAESFELETNGTLFAQGTNNGWYGAADAITVVTTNYSYTNACGLPLRYPPTTHTNVLQLESTVTNILSGGTASNIWVDFILNPVYWIDTNHPPVSNEVQMACYVNTNGYLALWHADFTNVSDVHWTVISNTSYFIDTTDWVRVSINMDYETLSSKERYEFQVKLDGDLVTNAAAHKSHTDLTPGGSWFTMANGTRNYMQSLSVSGTGFLDDLVVTNGTPPFPPYTITASAGANGSISPLGDVVVTNHGGSTNFTITASNSFHIASIQTNGAPITGSPYSDDSFISTNYTWSNITADGDINAQFAANSCTITSTAGANGSISPAGDVVVAYNGSTTFVITANSYYRIDSIETNDNDIVLGEGSPWNDNSITNISYTWSNITAYGTIYACFEPRVDTNGVPEEWLDRYDLDIGDATNDVDGDGLFTWEEYVAGTDPTNDASVFAILDQGYLDGSNYVVWYSTTNSGVTNAFGMYRSTNLTLGTPWVLVMTNDITREDSDPDGTGTNTWWDETPPADVPAFYRPIITWTWTDE